MYHFVAYSRTAYAKEKSTLSVQMNPSCRISVIFALKTIGHFYDYFIYNVYRYLSTRKCRFCYGLCTIFSFIGSGTHNTVNTHTGHALSMNEANKLTNGTTSILLALERIMSKRFHVYSAIVFTTPPQ